MKKLFIIVAAVIITGTICLTACNRCKNTQSRKSTNSTEVKEKVEDAAAAVGTAIKTKTENAIDTVKNKAETVKDAAEKKAESIKQTAKEKAEAAKTEINTQKKKAAEELDKQKRKAGNAIVNAAEKIQDKLDD